MIRLLHAADLHLDSPFQSLKARQALERRVEQRQLVARIAALARERQADMLVFAGDVFDSDALFSETGRSLESALARLDIPVFFAPGNHDWYAKHSLWSTLSLGDNVHIFSGEAMECVFLPDLGVRVWGTAFTGRSRRAPLDGFEAEKDGDLVDIMVLHGDVGKSGSPYGPIEPEELARSGMDYVALGHSHSFSGLRRAGETYYAWPGCAEGRGFDECGEKGVILAEIEPGQCRIELVPIAGRKYEILKVDITDKPSPLQAIEDALAGGGEGDVYRIVLEGEAANAPDLALLHKELAGRFYALQLRDETRPKRALWDGCGTDSLRGLFLTKLRRLYDGTADEKQRRRIVQAARWGLRALDNGEELPL